MAKLDVEEAKLLLTHRVILLGYQLAFESEIEKHNKERKDRFSIIARYLSTRPLASPKLILEKDLIESQIRLVEKFMNEVSARKNGLKNELEILTGIKDLQVGIEWSKLPPIREKEFYRFNIDQGPRFKKIRQQLLLGENRVEEARLQARPDITLGVNYRQENISPRNYFYHGQVAIVIPIVDRGQYSVQTAKAQLRREEAGVKLAEQEFNTTLNYSYENLLAANESLKLFPISLKGKSIERFKNAEEAFRKGQIDVMTFLQSDIQVHENISLVYTSRLEYLSALSNLELLVGKNMESK
jgi:outer membrane protein TolC